MDVIKNLIARLIDWLTGGRSDEYGFVGEVLEFAEDEDHEDDLS